MVVAVVSQCEVNNMFSSSFWLLLGLFNIIVAVIPPHTNFAFFSVALAIFCFYNFVQTRKEEQAIRKEEEDVEDLFRKQ